MERKTMNKQKLKPWVDLVMLLDFLVLATSGFILKFFRGDYPLWDRRQWLTIHDYASYGIVALILIHLILNWAWIKCTIVGVFKKKEGCEVKVSEKEEVKLPIDQDE